MTIKSALYWSALVMCTAISLGSLAIRISGDFHNSWVLELTQRVAIKISIRFHDFEIYVLPTPDCPDCGGFFNYSFPHRGHQETCKYNLPPGKKLVTDDTLRNAQPAWWRPYSLGILGYRLTPNNSGGGFRLELAWWHPAWIFGLFPLTQVPYLWRRFKPKSPGHCAKCTYDLTGNTSGVCPECGTPTVPRP